MPVRRLVSSTRRRRYGVVSWWESRASSATRFAAALADSLQHRHEVARIASTTPAPVDAHPSGSAGSLRPLAAIAGELNQCDVAIIHHSVDDDGLSNRVDATASSYRLLDVIAMICVPTIVVLHHVPADPTADQRRTLARACRSADVVAVTAAPAAARLASTYGVDPSALWLLRSGPTSRRGSSMRTRRPTIVTWGMIAPGGGIESMIDTMEHLSALNVRYLIAGPTSDGLVASEAGNYRGTLIRRCWIRGVAAHVTFARDDADQTAMTEALRGPSLWSCHKMSLESRSMGSPTRCSPPAFRSSPPRLLRPRRSCRPQPALGTLPEPPGARRRRAADHGRPAPRRSDGPKRRRLVPASDVARRGAAARPARRCRAPLDGDFPASGRVSPSADAGHDRVGR